MMEQGYTFTLKEKVCGIHFPDGRTLAIKPAKDKLFYIIVQRHHKRYYSLSQELPNATENTNECVISYNHKPKDINGYHDKFGHLGESLLRKTLKHLKIEVKGTLKSCDACKMAKARAMNMKKKTDTRSDTPGERMYIDLTGPFKESLGG
jgi:hypothetical protein